METWKAYIIKWIVSGELTIGKKGLQEPKCRSNKPIFYDRNYERPCMSSWADSDIQIPHNLTGNRRSIYIKGFKGFNGYLEACQIPWPLKYGKYV